MIKFDVRDLKKFISKASKFALKGIHPVIFDYIYVSSIDNNKAKLTVTDMRAFYSETISVNGKTNTPFLLNLKQLKSITANMKNGYIEVDGNVIKVGEVSIQAQSDKGVNVEDYPVIPRVKSINKVSIDEFKKLKTIMFKQDDDGRAPFSSLIYINVKDKEVVRTDKHKLSVCKINCEGEKDIKIPDFIVSFIDSSKVEIQCDSENNLRIVSGNIEIITKIDDVEYPGYKNVFPQEYQAEILLPGSIIEKLKLLQNKHIKFQIRDNKIAVFYWDNGICVDFINDIGKVERGEVEVSFNKEYLLWLLSPAIDNLDLKRRIVIKAYLNSESPSLFCLVGNDDWKALLMPVRF